MTAFETLAALCDGAPLKTSTITVNIIDVLEVLNDLDQLRKAGAVKRGKAEYPVPFLAAYDAMKDHGSRWREGSTPAAAFKQWQARIKAGADAELIYAGTVRYALYCKATGAEVKMAQTFFGPGEHYTPEWAVPSRAARAPHQTANEKAREWADQVTGRAQNVPANTIIDINPAPRTPVLDWRNLAKNAS